jgi:hypothetical protein
MEKIDISQSRTTAIVKSFERKLKRTCFSEVVHFEDETSHPITCWDVFSK